MKFKNSVVTVYNFIVNKNVPVESYRYVLKKNNIDEQSVVSFDKDVKTQRSECIVSIRDFRDFMQPNKWLGASSLVRGNYFTLQSNSRDLIVVGECDFVFDLTSATTFKAGMDFIKDNYTAYYIESFDVRNSLSKLSSNIEVGCKKV